MSEFQIKQATRAGILPLVGFYGRSGSGKTMSAILLARGIAGPTGRITLIDSENRRGSLFADIIPGGYQVIDIDAPFSPERYIGAIVEAEKSSDIIVIDSLSHEWSGEGGVLDMQESELDRMAGDNWNKREACKMAAWIKPKLAHKQMVMRLLRCKLPLICCLRGEEKTHMVKGADNKNKVVTDEFSSPLFDQRFIFELLLNFETVARNGKGGYVIPRKITHPTIASLLPSENEQISIAHGQSLAQWCSQAGAGKAITQPAAQSTPAVAPGASGGQPEQKQGEQKKIEELELTLWKILKPIRTKDRKGWGEVNAYLWREEILDAAKEPPEQMPGLSVERLMKVIEKCREKFPQ